MRALYRLIAASVLWCGLLAGPALAALTATTKGNGQNSGNHSLTLNSITVASGDLILVGGSINKAASGDAIVVTNNLGDSFTVYECARAAGQTHSGFIAWAYSSGMSGGSVTVADDAAATATAIAFSVYGLNGVPASSPEDAASRACANSSVSGPTTSPTVTSGVPTQAGNLFFSAYASPSNGGTIAFTEDATWTGAYGTGNTSTVELTGYKINSGSSAVTRSPTTASRLYAMPITSFKDGAPATRACRMTLLGVGC